MKTQIQKTMKVRASIFGCYVSVGQLLLCAVLLCAAVYSILTGDDSGVTLAAAIVAGAATGGGDTQVVGEPISTDNVTDPADPSNLLVDYIDKKLRQKHRSKNPANTILRAMGKRSANSFVYKFWSMDERPLSCLVQAAYTATTATTATITVDNAASFIRDNVLMAVGLSGYDDRNPTVVRGTLKLEVLDVLIGTNQLKVQTVNGAKSGSTFPVPSLPAGTRLVRIGTCLQENAAKTDPYGDLPEDEFNYVQRFGMTVAMTPFFKEHAKEIDFGLDIQLDRRFRELLEEQEASILFGSRAQRISIDKNALKRYMGGFEYFCNNKFEYDSTVTRFTREEYSDIMAQLFAANSGSSHRLLFCGSDLISRFNNSTEVIRNTTDLKPSVIEGIDVMGLRGLGSEVDIIRHPLFDAYGLANQGLFVDLDNAGIVSWGGLQRKKLHPELTGESNEEKYFITEPISLEVTYPETHMWIKPSTQA
jgi:hypothetical protein